MPSYRRIPYVLLTIGLAAVSLTCSGDNPMEPAPPVASLAAGAPTRLNITRQPPANALDKEVWAPGTQPSVTVKDANGVGVFGAAVTASVLTGSGTLQGDVTVTTNANGAATFPDLGIAGTGSHTLSFTTGSLTANSASIAVSALPSEAASGKWDPKVSWDIVPLHIHLLPTGKILAWGKLEVGGSMGMPRLWNPAAGPPTSASMASVGLDTMLFCAGHALMPDGRLMVSGGHKADDRGIEETNIFDPTAESWTPNLPKMAKGRWYPTVTTLSDGRMVTVAGRDASSNVVLIPEVWENGRWVQLPGAGLLLPYYPRDFVAPNTTKLFYAGERVKSRWLDVDATGANGRGRWSSSAGLTHAWAYNRDYGSAVMYETGKILYVGGGGNVNWSTPDPKTGTPTATAETIDLNVAGPRWTMTGTMSNPRRHLNATVLPDGQVLVTGGTRAGGFNDLSGAVRDAEVWDPQTDQWTVLARSSVDRAYHSVSLLLPDGTVLHGASGDANIPNTSTPYPRQNNHEIFRPPYLFKGARPTITNVSKSSVTYGEKFTVNTPYAAQITAVRWIRLGSVTHAFDANQRANTLTFTRGSGKLTVTAPSNGRRAPPGHYLLFILNRNRVPSVGAIVQVR
jgi:galactose oxidase